MGSGASRRSGKAPTASSARARFTALHAELRERICLLRYPPGVRLGEEALAAEFGVSRTPIRRVLNRLESEGLVESRHGVGTVVTTIDMANLRQVYALRMRLAELIGELDPVPAGAAEIGRLAGLRDSLAELVDDPDPDRYCHINMAYHLELIGLIGNAALRDMTEKLYFQTTRIWLESVGLMNLREEIEIFRQEIAETVVALQRSDHRAVGFIWRNHIAASLHRMTRERPAPPAAAASA